jgi:serine/threonine protein kinase
MVDLTRPIADYEPIELLGQGSHGECVVARPPARLDLATDRVVVKVHAAPASPEACRRVAAELRLIGSLGVAELVPVHDAGRHRGAIFTVSALCAGGSLTEPATTPTRAQILSAVADAARAAHALHEGGVAHRAIKPSNIMLDGAGGRLADVGLAHLIAPGQTMTGLGPVAALEYTEPGALLGRPAGRASDIWALAVTLHRALTSSSVFGELPNDVFGSLRHVLETPPTLAPGLRDDEAELLAWCLRPERVDRPATAEMVADRLDALAEAT